MTKKLGGETPDSNMCVEEIDDFVKDDDTNPSESKIAIEFVEMLEAEYCTEKYDEVFNRMTEKEKEDLRKSLFEQYLE